MSGFLSSIWKKLLVLFRSERSDSEKRAIEQPELPSSVRSKRNCGTLENKTYNIYCAVRDFDGSPTAREIAEILCEKTPHVRRILLHLVRMGHLSQSRGNGKYLTFQTTGKIYIPQRLITNESSHTARTLKIIKENPGKTGGWIKRKGGSYQAIERLVSIGLVEKVDSPTYPIYVAREQSQLDY